MAEFARAAEIAELAAGHDLVVDPSRIRINEAGLDYQVAFAFDEHDLPWVLRIPRRRDVADKIDAEAQILELVGARLAVQVPHWRICSRQLIAYPSLPGDPGLTLDADGAPVWHFDPQSETYARSFGRLLAQLHTIDQSDAIAAGAATLTPTEVREEWRSNLTRVAAEFEIAGILRADWEAWLDDDGLWPEFTTFTHGELYPAHLLLASDGTIASVIDWTTARVGDPVVDFAIHHAISAPATFELTLAIYAEQGGRVPLRLAERCEAAMAASPLGYALFALTSKEPEHLAIAAAMLNPS